MPAPVTLAEEAFILTTVRISAGMANSAPTSTGTGFLYKVTHPTSNVVKCFLITNKHVIQNAEVVHFLLSHAASLTDLNDQNQPVGRQDDSIILTLAENLFLHRDDAVDLCAIDVTVQVGNIMATGRKLRSLIIDASWLPDETSRRNMRTVEPVMVVGYPRGLFDAHNNMPIVRRGGTATHPLAHYQNKRDFLIDVAAYGGSSGSPVFGFESPFYRLADGTLSPGSKGQFLGVVWGVIESTSQGILHVVEIPSGQSQIPLMQTSMNLAIALHGELILDFDDQIFPSGAEFVPLAF